MQTPVRTIAHIDADCFFASVELLTRPELRGKPVLACNRTDARGIVLAATYEARPFGIHAGTPVFKAKKLCPHAIIIPSHFQRYQVISKQLMALIKTISPDVEVASIDEAYAELTGLELMYRTDYRGIGQMLQALVKRDLGITVSIGIAPTKVLAKIASDFRKPSGLTIVTSENRTDFLKAIPIGKIPGVGRATEASLTTFGMTTAFDIATAPRIAELLGKRGVYVQQELRGIPCSRVAEVYSPPQSLANTRTFADFSVDKKYIFAFAFELLITLTRRLRSHGMQARTMHFFLITKAFRHDGMHLELTTHSNEDAVFIQKFKEMFNALFQEMTVYRKAGFSLGDLSQDRAVQPSLFETIKKNSNLEKALDSIYAKFGKKGITRGSLLLNKR